MSENRKYYWLKLKEDFFEDKTTKYLQSLPDGYKLIICYLKMQLKALKTDGVIKYDRLFPTNVEELALILDEDINIVKLMLEALKRIGAVEELNDGSLAILAMEELVGSETNWAKLKRQQRQKLDNVQQVSRKCLPEIEIEKDIDIKKENIKEKNDELISHFNKIMEHYPKKSKEGKTKALQFFLQWINGRQINHTKIKLTDEQMFFAVMKYAKQCEENKIEDQYIKRCDNFFKETILDYVEV